MQSGELALYNEHPVGNSPKFMPWDTSLNQDLHLAVKQHVALTNDFDKSNPRKFDMSTSLQGNAAYLQLFDPTTGNVPSSSHILQDCYSILDHLQIVYATNSMVI